MGYISRNQEAERADREVGCRGEDRVEEQDAFEAGNQCPVGPSTESAQATLAKLAR
jgi:hypothetical protein